MADVERSAYLLTFWKLGRYSRTYPVCVEDGVREALAEPGHFTPPPPPEGRSVT